MSDLARLQAAIPSGWRVDKDGDRCRTQLCAGDLRELAADAANGRLRFNSQTRFMEWRGRRVEEADARLLYVSLQIHGYMIGESATLDALLAEARRHTFHPVVEMLGEIRSNDKINPVDLDTTLAEIYGTADPLHVAMIRKTLIAAVARAMKPGCQVDTVLVLQSERQGMYKSQSFKALAGENFYSSSTAAGKDQILLIQATWILELAEIDAITGSRDAGALKNVISTGVDTIRVPYGRSPEPMPRQGIIVGSSNRADFLRDATGSRRFWVVPISRPIDIDLLRSQRDQIWKAAINAYENGEQWWFDGEVESLVQDRNRDYEQEHPFMPALRRFVQTGPEAFTTADALVGSGCRDKLQLQQRDEMAASDCLRLLGFEKRRVQVAGHRQYLWHRKQLPNMPNPPGEVGQLKTLAAQPTAQPAQPAQPVSEKLGEKGQETEKAECTKTAVQVGQVGQATAAQPVSAAQPVPNPAEVRQREVRTNTRWIDSALVALAASGKPITERSVTEWLQTNHAPSISNRRIAQVLTDYTRAESPSLLE